MKNYITILLAVLMLFSCEQKVENTEASINAHKLNKTFSSNLSKEDISSVMTAVSDWQIDNFDAVKHHDLDWTNGALYAGMMEWAKLSTNSKYLDWLYKIGKKYQWQPYFRMYHADDVVVSQMYLEMYKLKLRENDKSAYRILAPTKARLDYVMAHPSQGTLLLKYDDPQTLEKWSWCDALFMAPPVYTEMANLLNDESYIDFMNQEFKVTHDFLYDKDEHLYYRDHRYFPDLKREENGEKIFWGRGNGWVMGGLVAILKDLPEDSKYRPFYLQTYKEMAAKVINCQDDNGFWHASMLNHESFPDPEVSSSSFFTYALTYGVNEGILDKATYAPLVTKAWQAITSAVYADGKLGWVQPIGQDPKTVTADMTEVYGVGAFLLAGTEMLRMVD